MRRTLRELIESLFPASPAARAQDAEHALQLATAVMLVEVMRADGRFDTSELEAVRSALCNTFTLSDDEAASLAELAGTTAEQATDLFSFTSLIDGRFEMPQKLRMIELMWRVAYADGRLTEHERHVMWRIADLLHVPQGAYVHARMRARQDAGVA
jgi:uncharacterized tellurite resistance protein B-like protein